MGEGIEEMIGEDLGLLGLSPRGGFLFEEGEEMYGEGWRSGLLVGNLGGLFWEKFMEGRKANERNGLDEWTKRVLDPLGEKWGARVEYPFEGPPYYPFVSWAMRGEGLKAGPLGILVHPRYGLWHGYRGIFLWREKKDFREVGEGIHPCDHCEEKPCVSVCPVGAVSLEGGLDVGKCRHYLEGGGGEDCIKEACQARRKCVVGREYGFAEVQSRYHTLRYMGRGCSVEESMELDRKTRETEDE